MSLTTSSSGEAKRRRDHGQLLLGFIVPEAAQAVQAIDGSCGRSTPTRRPRPRPWTAWYKEGAKLPRGTYRDVADHIDHIVKVAGIDHVGIGSDFDGITRWPVGLDDVSSYPA